MRIRFLVENGDTQAAIQQFLRSLLTESIVDILLVPMRTPAGTVAPALVSDPAMLAHADLLAPVLPVNSAALAGSVSARKPRPRLGAVLRSCELRALVELVKFQQASLEDMLLISVDCAGTYGVTEFLALEKASGHLGGSLWEALFDAAQGGAGAPGDPSLPPLRQACRMCEQPVYDRAAVVIELLGRDLTQEVVVSLPEALGQKLGGDPAEAGQRAERVDALIKTRAAVRDEEFATIRGRMEGEENLSGVFAACIRCHNCMTVCPICYCKTCVFKSQVFDHEPMQYVTWTRQKGAFRMPPDTTLFHLTRLNHMVLSCVGCGMCTEACPVDLPVGTVFRAVGQRVQQVFDYVPGRDVEEKPPLVTFKADEWTEVGE